MGEKGQEMEVETLTQGCLPGLAQRSEKGGGNTAPSRPPIASGYAPGVLPRNT